MEKKHGEDCGKEDEGRSGAEREECGENHGYGQKGPTEIFNAGRGDVGEEGEGFREGGVERDGLYAVLTGRGEVCMGTGQGNDAAAAFFIADNAGMDGCLANKGVGTVSVLACGTAGRFFGRTPYNERSPIDVLSSYSMRCGDMNGFTVGRTPKGLVGIVERTASVPVEATTVSPRPDWFSFEMVEGKVWSLTSSLLHTRLLAACHNP